MTKIRLLTLILAALSGTAMAEVAQARHFSRAMMLINHSHVPVSAFYASNSGDDAWKEDLLDGARLRPNHYVALDLDDATGYCRFDFKTVFVDGTSVVRRNIDTCSLNTYTLTD
jgi:hypothetical protein